MRRNLFTITLLITLCSVTLVISVATGQAQRAEFESPTTSRSANIKPLALPIAQSKARSIEVRSIEVRSVKSQPVKAASAIPQPISQSIDPLECALQPETSKAFRSRNSSKRPLGSVELERFRRTIAANAMPLEIASQIAPDKPLNPMNRTAASYQPRDQKVLLIDPTNYGDRYFKDVNGKPVDQLPIVVLHETVGSAGGTLNFFLTPHRNDDDQASYHTLIQRNGTVWYLVPPDKRAFGAGNSIFVGANGVAEAVRTHPKFPPSVNNFAYHVALESPPDGNTNAPTHSGYTTPQYQSLAWVVAQTGVPDDRITTHKAVDRSGQRMDPRSFRDAHFFQLLKATSKTFEIPIGCTDPQAVSKLKQPIQQAKNVSRRPQQKQAI